MVRFFTVILFGIFCAGVGAIAEEITLTTYYPAPYGAYEDLVSDRLTVNDDLYTSGLYVNGNRTYLRIPPGSSYHWLMAGGTAEGSDNALGFGSDDTVRLGSNWSFGGLLRCYGLEVSNPAYFKKNVIIEGSADLVAEDAVFVGGDANVTGNVNCGGKGTFTGGVDPPYISFSSESHDSIREFAKSVVEHEKVMQFWNGEMHRLEVYVIEEDKFYTITGKLIEG